MRNTYATAAAYRLSLSVLAGVLALVPFVQVSLARFSDVPATHPYAAAIQYVQDQGIVTGYPDGTFRPDQRINRAEFIKLVMDMTFGNAVSLCDPAATILFPDTGERMMLSFPDVPASSWYARHACIAKQNRIVAGYPDGTFRPTNNISFAEAAKIIVNAMAIPTSPDPVWYKPFMNALAGKNAIPSSITGPDALLTRGEMAEVIYRLKNASYVPEQNTAQNISTQRLSLLPPGLPLYTNSAAPDGGIAFARGYAQTAYFAESDDGSTSVYVGDQKIHTYPSSSVDFFDFSPDGSRLGYAVQSRSTPARQYAVIGGIQGKTYDAISSSIVFSPDGKNVAYTAVQGNDAFVVLNGAEQKHYLTAGTPDSLIFSNAGSLAYNAGTYDPALGKLHKMAVVDGTEGTPYDDISFSGLGAHDFRFTDDGTILYGARSGNEAFVVQGNREGKHYPVSAQDLVAGGINSIVASKDGKHVAFIAPADAGRKIVVFDGRESAPYDFVSNITVSPAGTAIAYLADRYDVQRGGMSEFLVVNGQEEGQYGTIDDLKFLADGSLVVAANDGHKEHIYVDGTEVVAFEKNGFSHGSIVLNSRQTAFAYVGDHPIQNGTGREVTWFHGTEGKEYTYIHDPVVSPDGSSVAYIAEENGLKFVVAGGRESERYDEIWPPVYTEDGMSVIYAARRGREIYRVQQVSR